MRTTSASSGLERYKKGKEKEEEEEYYHFLSPRMSKTDE